MSSPSFTELQKSRNETLKGSPLCEEKFLRRSASEAVQTVWVFSELLTATAYSGGILTLSDNTIRESRIFPRSAESA